MSVISAVRLFKIANLFKGQFETVIGLFKFENAVVFCLCFFFIPCTPYVTLCTSGDQFGNRSYRRKHDTVKNSE